MEKKTKGKDFPSGFLMEVGWNEVGCFGRQGVKASYEALQLSAAPLGLVPLFYHPDPQPRQGHRIL